MDIYVYTGNGAYTRTDAHGMVVYEGMVEYGINPYSKCWIQVAGCDVYTNIPWAP